MYYRLSRSPGFESIRLSDECRDWPDVLSSISSWLSVLKLELETQDPWEALESQRHLAPTVVEYNKTANRPFTASEAQKIEATLANLVHKLEEVFPDVSNRVANLSIQVDSLVHEAREGRGRIDWTNQFVGFLLQVLLMVAATPTQAVAIWTFIRGSLGSAFGLFLP